MNYKSVIYSEYLSDADMQALVSDEALIKKMIEFEVELAQAQGEVGLIPSMPKEEIVKTLKYANVKPSELSKGTLQNGVPVIPFLQLVQRDLSEEGKKYLHYGVTSQDVLDTSQVLILRDATQLIEERLNNLKGLLHDLITKYGSTRCMARTRGQLAVPISFGMKLNSWLQPLERQTERLREIGERLFKIQLGGAAGDRSFFKENGKQLVNTLSKRLGLKAADSWHSQRDTLSEFTNWLAMLTGITGKMGADILVMSQNEINEISELSDGGGASSAMPHKNNPVLSEALVAMARLTSSLQSQQLQSLVHVNERDATAWILDWSTVPEMLLYAATSLRHAITISSKMKVNTANMEKNVAEFEAGKRK